MVAKRTTPAVEESVSESVRALRDATTRLTSAQAELDRRLDEAGLGGMAGMQTLLARVGQVLAPIDGNELARAQAGPQRHPRLEVVRAEPRASRA
jgi:hypothetical protein